MSIMEPITAPVPVITIGQTVGETSPARLAFLGLGHIANETREWRTDRNGARDARRAQHRADQLYKVYRKQSSSDAADAAWLDYQDAAEQARSTRSQHQDLRRQRTRVLRMKGAFCVGVFVGSFMLVPTGYCFLAYSLGAVAGAVTLQQIGRREIQKQPRRPRYVPQLELVPELTFDHVESEGDSSQLLQDVLMTKGASEERAFTGDILDRLQDRERFGDQYMSWTVQELSSGLKAAGAHSRKIRIGLHTRAGFNFDGITTALNQSQAA